MIILGSQFYDNEEALLGHKQFLLQELELGITTVYPNPFQVLPNDWQKRDQIQRIDLYFEKLKEVSDHG